MKISKNTTVEKCGRNLAKLPAFLAVDGRTKVARKKQAQRFLLIATATDEELERMAKIPAAMVSSSVV